MENISGNTEFGWAHKWTESDGSRNTFYSDHYNKVRKSKGEDIINDTHYNGKENGFIHNHELSTSLGQGKKIIFPDGKIAFVDSVYKHWDKGYYLYLLYYIITEKGDRSHGGFFYKNISSHCPNIIKYIDENKNVRFEDSTIDEKLNIIIENRKKLNLPTIIHINEKDSKLVKTHKIYDYLPLNIWSSININNIIKQYKLSKEPLFLSDAKIDIQHKKHKNLIMIDILGLNQTEKEDIIYLHRNFEK